MEIREDGLGIPPPGVVFKASKYQTAEEWHDREEAAKWHPGVVVSFQENAWVNAKTHMHQLREILSCWHQKFLI